MSRTWREILQSFNDLFPQVAEKGIDWYPSGEFEITAKLSDGSKVIYDHISKTIKTIHESNDNKTEEQWREEFSEALERKMWIRGISQRELADLTGISQQAISRYINGTSCPSAYAVNRIAMVLHCSPTELVSFN